MIRSQWLESILRNQQLTSILGSRRRTIILATVVLLASIVSLYCVWILPARVSDTIPNVDTNPNTETNTGVAVANEKADTTVVNETGAIIRAAAETQKAAEKKQAATDQAIVDTKDEAKKANERVAAAEETARMEQELRLKAEEEVSRITKERSSTGEQGHPPIEPEVSRFGVRVAANNGVGVRITDVTDNSVGHEAGLKRGDVIFIIDSKRLTSLKDFSDAVDNSGEKMVLDVGKADSGKVVELTFVMPKAQRDAAKPP